VPTRFARQERQRVRKPPQAASGPPLGFTPQQCTLLVGEGDLSFGCALARLFAGDGSRLLVTTFDEHAELGKYEAFEGNAAELRAAGAAVGLGVDATDLGRSLKAMRRRLRAEGAAEGPPPPYDRIVFNFPHRGAGIKDQDANVRSNQELVSRFFASALPLLAPRGELLLSLKSGLPYSLWGVCKLASAASANALQLRTAHVFESGSFPGYRHRHTLGDATSKPTEEELSGGARTYVWRRSEECARVAEAEAEAAGRGGEAQD